MAELIDGKLVAQSLRADIKEQVARFEKKHNITPGLSVIIVGENQASKVYVRNKEKACFEVGITSYVIAMPESTTQDELLAKIEELNCDSKVHGILVQLPLPPHINEDAVIKAINPMKDVDAFHPVNVGGILIGKYAFLPCTPAGVMSLLDHYGVEIKGKKCVVLGRSNIVGKPMALLLLERNGTVTICHSKTQNLRDEVSSADILVVAIGKPEFITGDMIKQGAVVIDVGINRNQEGKLVGDVEFASASQKAAMITPVPGGVGPMTITTLLMNTLTAAKLTVEA